MEQQRGHDREARRISAVSRVYRPATIATPPASSTRISTGSSAPGNARRLHIGLTCPHSRRSCSSPEAERSRQSARGRPGRCKGGGFKRLVHRSSLKMRSLIEKIKILGNRSLRPPAEPRARSLWARLASRTSGPTAKPSAYTNSTSEMRGSGRSRAHSWSAYRAACRRADRREPQRRRSSCR